MSRRSQRQNRCIVDPRKVTEIGREHELINLYAKQRVKTPADLATIRECLRQHFIFAYLEDQDIERVMQDMVYFEIPADTSIFIQDSPGLIFFVLASGECQVIIDNKPINTVNLGQGFGELALMHDSPRSASVKAVTNATLWGLSRTTFRQVTR